MKRTIILSTLIILVLTVISLMPENTANAKTSLLLSPIEGQFTYLNKSSSSFTCNETLTIQSNPNSNGVYCGPSRGSFITNSQGIANIYNLCQGTYTICVDGHTIGSINITNADTGSWKFQGYNASNLPPCTCDD